MAISVQFYVFSKRKNSTAQVSGTGTTVPVLLKDECTQENPILKIHSADFSTYANYNYVYIPIFSRYYFITSKEVHNGSEIWLYCEEDYLGSFKATIQTMTNVFIDYCSDITSNIPDSRIKQTSSIELATANAALNHTTFTVNGCSIISSVGDNTSGLFILSNARDIYDIFDGIQWDIVPVPSGNDEKEAILSGFGRMIAVFEQFFTKGNAPSGLRNAISLPWVVHGSAIGEQVEDLKICSFPTGKTVYRVASEIVTDYVNITIPWLYNDWRRSSEFTSLFIYLPLFGLQALPVDQLKDDTTLRVSYAFSYSNGDICYQVEGMQSGHIVSIGNSNVSAPLSVGSSNTTSSRVAETVSTNAASMAGSGSDDGILSAIGDLVGGAVSSLLHIPKAMNDVFGNKPVSMNAGGGFGGHAGAALDTIIHLYVLNRTVSTAPATMASAYGYPNFKVGSLSGKTGFTKLNGAVFASNGTQKENDSVTRLLNTGFYIE